MSGGSMGTTTTSTSPTPWLGKQLQYAGDQAIQQYKSNAPAYYPGSTVANQSPATQAGYQAAVAAGLNPSATQSANNNYLTNTLNGGYLGQNNPYTAQINKSIEDQVNNNVESQFSAAGRYGSPSMGSALATAETNALAAPEYQNYQNERGLQNSASAFGAPQANSTMWQNINGLQGAGSAQDQFAQNQVNANVNHWNYNQNLPQNKLSQLFGLLSSGSFGQNSTTTQTQPGGGFLGAAGGAIGALPALLGSGGLPALFGK